MSSMKMDNIRIDGDTQPRTDINTELVTEYAAAMKAGAKFPAVIVFHDGDDYWLVDGFHRWHAAKEAKLKKIDCDIREGTLEEARWFSYQVNADHGLRRTNADKNKAVKAALLHPKAAQMSDGQIAEHVGVDHKTVAKVRKELAATREIPKSTNRTGRDGRTINTAKIGRCKRREEEEEALQAEEKPEVEDEFEVEDEPDDEGEYEDDYEKYEDDSEYEEGESAEDEEEEELAEEEGEDDFSETEELEEEEEEFDIRQEGRDLKIWLREKLDLWPEEYRPKAASLIRQVLEKDFDLSL